MNNVFAFDPRGAVLVVADGAEVLVHGGDDERPLWRRTQSAAIIGLGAAADMVAVLEEGGRISLFRAMTGEPLESVTEASASSLVMAADGRVAVVVEGGIAIVTRGQTARRLAVEDASAVAFSKDGSRIAVGTQSGKVSVFDTFTLGTPDGTAEVGPSIRSICWNAKGFWIASGDDRIFEVAANAGTATQMTRAGGMKPDCLTCSQDGALLGVRLDEKTVVALVLPSKDTVGSFIYLDREASGVAFGPGPKLGIGLVGGDGNIMDLANDGVLRTDTHPGRTHNRWMLKASIESHLVPAATKALGQKSAPRQTPGSAAPVAPARPAESSKAVYVAIGVLVAIGALMMLVARLI